MLNGRKGMSLVLVAVAVAVVIIGAFFVFRGGVEKGRVVFAVTDAAANLGNVTSIVLTVDSISAHKSSVNGSEDNESGWVAVSSVQKSYDLLQLKAEGSKVLFADVQLETGVYQQVRLKISKIIVVDAEGEHEAKLPSKELKIVGQVVVEANSTSAVTFDFIADESLHTTGSGLYIFAPVVYFESKQKAEVEIKEDNEVVISDGTVKANIKVGMNEKGEVGAGLSIKPDAEVEFEDGSVVVKGKMKSSGSVGVGSVILPL